MSELIKCPESEDFKVLGTMTLPHEYIVGVNRELFNKDPFGQELTYQEKEDLIRKMEAEHGPSCAAKGCNKTYDEHVLTLVIEADITDENEEALQKYLELCKPFMEENNIEGFAFMPKQVGNEAS